MRLPARHSEVFRRLNLVAVYAIGPSHLVHTQSAMQHALMWEWIASGVGANGPPEPRSVVTSYWPVRWGLTGDVSEKLIGQANTWSPAWTNELLARCWCRSRGEADQLYGLIRGGTETIRLSWDDQGKPMTREWLELMVKGLATDACGS
jgi:hypothetical protein